MLQSLVYMMITTLMRCLSDNEPSVSEDCRQKYATELICQLTL